MRALTYTYSDLKDQFGFNRHTVWRLVRTGDFPAPMQISPGRVAWRRTDVDDWFQQRPTVPYAGADK